MVRHALRQVQRAAPCNASAARCDEGSMGKRLEDERALAKRLAWVYWFVAIDVIVVATVVAWAGFIA